MEESKMTSPRGKFRAFLSAAALIVGIGLLGCSSTPMWDPGAPDTLTAEHYALALAAIDAKAKQDSQAALYLLHTDVMRMRTNTAEMQVALARLYTVTNAVDKEDWGTARKGMDVLRASYGRPGSR